MRLTTVKRALNDLGAIELIDRGVGSECVYAGKNYEIRYIPTHRGTAIRLRGYAPVRIYNGDVRNRYCGGLTSVKEIREFVRKAVSQETNLLTLSS